MAQEGQDPDANGRAGDPLERLRGWRVRPERAAFSDAIASEHRKLSEAQRRRGSFEAAWAACAPDFGDPSLRAELVRGVVRVRCRSAATRFAVDQWLRDTGLRSLREACNTPIRGYRLHAS